MISNPKSSWNEIVGTTKRSIATMPSAWLRRNVFHPCEGGPLLRAIYLATLVWPTSMPSLRSSPWILGAPHNGLTMLISRISRRISNDTVGRPQRRRDLQRKYSLKPARCQRITVSGRTIASVSYIFGNSRQIPPNINRRRSKLPRRSTLICCLSIKISASSVARDRGRSITVPTISLHKSNIEQQHRPILDQLPAVWIYDRDRRVTGRPRRQLSVKEIARLERQRLGAEDGSARRPSPQGTGHLHRYFSVREIERMHDTRLLPNHKQAPSVAQLHQDRRLPEIVAGPGQTIGWVGGQNKTGISQRTTSSCTAATFDHSCRPSSSQRCSALVNAQG